MNYLSTIFLLSFCSVCFGQEKPGIIFPTTQDWNILSENQELSFQLKSDTSQNPKYSIKGIDGLAIHYDSLGNFSWKPSFDLVSRVEKVKEFPVIFQAEWPNGRRVSKTITFIVKHINRAPVVEELPIFYTKQLVKNSYQFSVDFISDPDGDPIVYKPVLTKMPEGASLSSQGLLTWSPSRNQFAQMKKDPLIIEFIVQDQPDKAETIARLRVFQTQQDLPPELLIVPADTLFSIKENETLNVKIYVSDPNGDDDVKSGSFISSDPRIPFSSFKENTPLQYELTWMPGYNFVEEVKKVTYTEITFFALDKTNNRAERKIKVKILDTENLTEKDLHQYEKYRDNLVDAMLLINELDANLKLQNSEYKKAIRGKKQRSIVNASIGAVSGFSPLMFQPDQAKVVGAIGGTTVLTLGTLEAAEVVGKSKQDIMERIKVNIEIRNKVQSAGDEFARRFALKSARRNQEFEKEIDKLRMVMNDQKLVLLQLDAENKFIKKSRISAKDIKNVFLDFSEE
ncbi:MAG TPA: hypothetical protein VFE57_13570 [Cyclobacteriaceae bacterium]|nr:hypothetical protein [Cyclobacteriaceae bacterium]